jgi:hypothetical protein
MADIGFILGNGSAARLGVGRSAPECLGFAEAGDQRLGPRNH